METQNYSHTKHLSSLPWKNTATIFFFFPGQGGTEVVPLKKLKHTDLEHDLHFRHDCTIGCFSMTVHLFSAGNSLFLC